MKYLILLFLISCSSNIEVINKNKPVQEIVNTEDVKKEQIITKTQLESCLETYSDVRKSRLAKKDKIDICRLVEKPLTSCQSRKGRDLFHYEKKSKNSKGKKILVFATFHGDETEGSVIASHWIKRLETIESRNTWRILPIMNPDGAFVKTRMNANKVDINRNFPTKDWNDLALKYWRSKTNSNPRRFPGPSGGSEPETKCAIEQIHDFSPDFVISIHTPYGLLDFDGPKIKMARFENLKWKRLGTFPGSLGRYLWVDRKIPVLTIELRANTKIIENIDKMNSLQDLSGALAIKSTKLLGR